MEDVFFLRSRMNKILTEWLGSQALKDVNDVNWIKRISQKKKSDYMRLPHSRLLSFHPNATSLILWISLALRVFFFSTEQTKFWDHTAEQSRFFPFCIFYLICSYIWIFVQVQCYLRTKKAEILMFERVFFFIICSVRHRVSVSE